MPKQTSIVLRYASAILLLAMLCSAHTPGTTRNWKKFCHATTPVTIKEIDFGKGSALSAKQMLMWGEWVISFKRDSLPCIKPYAPVESYTGKAFAITGLQAYSNHNGAALAEIIYDGRTGHKTWDIDIWKPHASGGTGAPAYHMSFYITGPVVVVIEKPLKQ